jgi:hypothetical protein
MQGSLSCCHTLDGYDEEKEEDGENDEAFRGTSLGVRLPVSLDVPGRSSIVGSHRAYHDTVIPGECSQLI